MIGRRQGRPLPRRLLEEVAEMIREAEAEFEESLQPDPMLDPQLG